MKNFYYFHFGPNRSMDSDISNLYFRVQATVVAVMMYKKSVLWSLYVPHPNFVSLLEISHYFDGYKTCLAINYSALWNELECLMRMHLCSSESIFLSTRPNHSHGRYLSLLSHMLSVRPSVRLYVRTCVRLHFSKSSKTKQISRESNVQYLLVLKRFTIFA